MASSIPVFKAALVSRLKADGRFSLVDVMYGLPAVNPGQDAVLIGNTRPDDPTRESVLPGGQSQWLGGGSTPCREERYVLEVLISVVRPWRSEQQATTERAFEIAAAIDDSLVAWQVQDTAFDGVVRWAQVTGVTHEEGHSATTTPDDTPAHRVTRILMDVACSNQF